MDRRKIRCLSDRQVEMARKAFLLGNRIVDIAKMLGVNNSTVASVIYAEKAYSYLEPLAAKKKRSRRRKNANTN